MNREPYNGDRMGTRHKTLRTTLLAILLAVLPACRGRTLSFLERESLLFRADNEELRAEDLEARYQKHRQKADRLSAELLELDRQRDALFVGYDALRSELAQAQKQRNKAAAALNAERQKRKQLEQALAKERLAVAKLKDAQKKRTDGDASSAKKAKTKSPE